MSKAMNVFAILGLGVVLGLRHAADPDHVVAVSAITARTRGVISAAWLGIVWGLGHTLTLFLVGGAIILFNLVVPPRVGLAFELAVALALVVVGLLNIGRPHTHAARTDGSGPAAEAKPAALRAFVVGLVHGLAGSAAVALLVLGTVRNPWWASAYLLVFGFGTVLGMALITVSLASPVALATRGRSQAGHTIRLATGVISLAFGVWLVYQIGFHDGLFLATPHWTPH